MINGIKSKVVLGFGIALVLMAAAGVLAFKSLSKLTRAVESVSKPDIRYQRIQAILGQISDAESGIRAFSLSKDEKYLEPYYYFLSVAENKLDSLKHLSADNPGKQKEIFLLDSLVNERLEVFFQFLDLKNSTSIQVSLADVVQKLGRPESSAKVEEKLPTQQIDSASLEPPIRPRLLSRIKAFLGKSDPKPAVNPLPTSTSSPKTVLKTDPGKTNKAVLQYIQKAEKEKVVQDSVLAHQELALLQKEATIKIATRKIISQIESEERSLAGQKLVDAKAQVDHSSRIIFTMGILAMFVMLVFLYFIFADIARSNKQKKALEESKKKTEELARVKEEFLANMSHEIRTPLNSISGFTNLLLTTKLEEKQRTYLEGVSKSSDHLLHVVNDILDFSKIEAGKLKIESTPFKLSDLVEEVVSTMKNVAQAKGLSLTSQLAPELKTSVFRGDPFRMKQVLLNLVSNGIKFTQEGKIQIRCSNKNKGENEVLLQIDVSDTGIGIPSDKIDTIFQEFSQADTSVTRKYGGTGLGLTICKKLAELLQGNIVVTSAVGKGSTFSFRVVCQKAFEQDLPQAKNLTEKQPVSGGLQSKKVLVADDDEMNRLLVKTILGGYGMQIDEAADGRLALQMATSNRYDLILSDIHMPELSGINLVRQIRAFPDKSRATTPILALTANVIAEDIQKYLAAGMDGYILKPFQVDELMEKIYSVLKLKHLPEPSPAIQQQRPSQNSTPFFNLEELKRASNGNSQFVVHMVGSFIKNTRVNLSYMKDDVVKQNWEGVGKTAHKMGPSCHNLKIFSLYDLLKKIETKSLTDKDYQHIPSLFQELELIAVPVLASLEQEYKNLKEIN